MSNFQDRVYNLSRFTPGTLHDTGPLDGTL